MVVVQPSGRVVMTDKTHGTCATPGCDACDGSGGAVQDLLPLELDTSRTVQAVAKFAQPVDDGDWICVFCHTFRGISAFGTPCGQCGGYSMSSFQVLTVRVHDSDIQIGHVPVKSYVELHPPSV